MKFSIELFLVNFVTTVLLIINEKTLTDYFKEVLNVVWTPDFYHEQMY